MTDYTKLTEDLRNIEKTMFALGTSPINMDNVSIRLAYDKRWGPTADEAAVAIEDLQARLGEAENSVERWKDMYLTKHEPKRGEIVRCRECLHYNAGFECLVEGYGIERDPDWFCGDGKRKVKE